MSQVIILMVGALGSGEKLKYLFIVIIKRAEEKNKNNATHIRGDICGIKKYLR